MTDLFLTVVGMSVTACFVIAAVMVLRLVLKKAPKYISYLLWAAVFFRLLCPFSIDIPIGVVTPVLVEAHNTDNYQYGENANADINADTPADSPHPVPAAINRENNSVRIYTSDSGAVPVYKKSRSILEILAAVWISGVTATAAYGIISLAMLKKRLKGAKYSGGAYSCQNIDNPFILGIFKPKIYLPEGLRGKQREYILKHENVHISRKDHLVKIVMYAALCVHWFNPLVWLSFKLCESDMEMSCDQKVTAKLSPEEKADYSQTLLNITVKKTAAFTACFGESGIKKRVKNVLYYKKPALWILILCVAAAAVSVVLLTANRTEAKEPESSVSEPDTLSEPENSVKSLNAGARYKTISQGLPYWIESEPCDYIVSSEKGYVSLITGELSEYGVILNEKCKGVKIVPIGQNEYPVRSGESDFPIEGRIYSDRMTNYVIENEISAVMTVCTEKYYDKLKELNPNSYQNYKTEDISLLFRSVKVPANEIDEFFRDTPEIILRGEAADNTELIDFSLELVNELSYIRSFRENLISWEEQINDKFDIGRWQMGKLFEDLEHSEEARELMVNAHGLIGFMSTDDLPIPVGQTISGNDEPCVYVREYDYGNWGYNSYWRTGYNYDSFYNAYLEVFTKETLDILFERCPFFYNYNGELWYHPVTSGGHLGIVHYDYELISETGSEIAFNCVFYGYSIDNSELWDFNDPGAAYDPAKKDEFVKNVIEYRFVLTENGWRVEKMANITDYDKSIEVNVC